MVATIKKWGNSYGIRIPKTMINNLSVTEGSNINIVEKNGKIIITPIEVPLTIEDLIEGMTREGVLDQYEEYPEIGVEII